MATAQDEFLPTKVIMTTAETWCEFFADWPAGIPRQGVIVTSLNESMPFKNFWLRGQLILLERTVPDVNGGRFLLLPFDVINTVKLTNPLNEATIADIGFTAAGALAGAGA